MVNLHPLTPHICQVIRTKWRTIVTTDSVTTRHPMYTSEQIETCMNHSHLYLNYTINHKATNQQTPDITDQR